MHSLTFVFITVDDVKRKKEIVAAMQVAAGKRTDGETTTGFATKRTY